MKKQCLSVVVPCYNEEEVLMAFYDVIVNVAAGMEEKLDFEFLLVDDGSADKTPEIMRELANLDSRVKYLSFSRNFGKEAGIYAGLSHATGDYVVVMDADLQHPPTYLPEMYAYLENGEYDSVAMRRISRDGEGKVRSFFSRKFYKVNQKISGVDIPEGATDYRMMTRQMVDAVLSLTEYNRFTKGIFAWVGFRTKWIAYRNVERTAGETKWSFWGLVKYSLNGITAFSTMPLVLSSVFGILFCLLAFLMMLWVVIKTLIWGDPVAGYPTLISVICAIGGIQLLMIGILGQYLSKSYMELKHRPIYLVRESNLQEQDNTSEE